jgi:hypothetical protein
MQIKLLKISVSLTKPTQFFVDFEFPDLKFVFKGMLYNDSTKRIAFPYLTTQTKGMYTPVCITDAALRDDIFKQMLALIQQETLPKITEEQSEYIKAEHARRIELDKRQEEFRKHVARAPAKPKENKGPNKALPKDSKQKAPPPVRPCTDPKGGRKNTFLSTFGAGFTEIPVPGRKH